MTDQIRRMRLPASSLSWGPEHDGIVRSYLTEMAGITGVKIENDQTNILACEGVIDRTVDSEIQREDDGQSLICQIGDDPNFFVRLHSWDETAAGTDGTVGHKAMNALRGKRVRVIVEVIDD